MKIAIIGAGAIGSALGALLARSGQDVTLVGRPAHVAAIRQDGLRVDGCLREFTVQVEAAETLDFRPDLALLTVKTQDVTVAVRDNLAYLTEVPLLTLQNGVRSDELVASLLPWPQILSAVVRLTATYLNPGRVTLLDQGTLIIGRPFGPRDVQVEEVACVLKGAVTTHVSDNIRGAHWLKLIVNLINALPALTNYTMRQVSADPHLSRLGVGLMREGLRVTDQAGIQLESLPQMPASLIRLIGRLPMGLTARMFAAMARRMESDWPIWGSTLQSIRRGRSTEIDYLNGEVVQLGKQVGVSTPLNAKVVELVHGVERTEQFLSVNAIRQAMDEGSHNCRP
ncbi:MAG: 2-dehydropantoate 2-reductase [Chloroflexota bacterium]